eukprot:2619303-Pyramimonas_sp.AAC.1
MNYVVLCCIAVVQGGAKIDGKDKQGKMANANEVIKGFSQLRKLIKQDIYRRARFRPRVSDVDFPTGELGAPDAAMAGPKPTEQMGEQEIDEFFSQHIGVLTTIAGYMA